MTRLDWDAMLAGLETQRAAAAAELEDIDAVIATVRRRAAPVVPIATIAQPPKNGAKGKAAKKADAAPANGKGQGKITPDQLATMRTQFETGVKVLEICKRVGVSDATVYTRAKEGKWKRPAKAKPAAAAATTPAGVHQLAGSVKCPNPECGRWTDTDPCKTCGEKLKRKW